MKTCVIRIGNVAIGGRYPVAVQSMTNTPTADVKATVRQIHGLERRGCEIVRVAVPDDESAAALSQIKRRISIPLVADIHFRHSLALKAIDQGVDKLRINPGNIGSRTKVMEVVRAAAGRNIPIRIGVNSGSVEKDLLRRYGGPTPKAMVESALKHIRILEDMDFLQIVVSLKAADVPKTISACRIMARKRNYPLHVGITEAGTRRTGSIYSAVGIGALLAEGIGNTIRVSLTANPLEELPVAWEILKALRLRERGPRIVSCPTCGRTRVNLIPLAEKVERLCRHIEVPLKIAVMGCEVNGPGEAAEADIGIACGKGFGWIIRKGKKVKRVPEADLVGALMDEISQLVRESEPMDTVAS